MTLGGALAFLMPGMARPAPTPGKAWNWRYRCLALERTLDELSDRLARTEIALLREEQASQQAKLRQAETENALVRVQSTLDALRRSQATNPENGPG